MPTNVNYRANISALKILNCTHIIATTATGSLKAEIAPGSIVILDDFIDRTKSRVYTFYDGSENSDMGVCHLPMSPAFDERTRQVVIETAKELGVEVFPKGTAVCIEGPRFSTKAESNLYRSWGADLVNMTICPEAILAKEKGILYASIAMATDYDCWRESKEGSVCVEEVMATFKKNVEKVAKLILGIVPNIQKLDWTDTIAELNAVVNSSIMLPNQYSK
jgi:5'-methylthioadenosine phosphorylase